MELQDHKDRRDHRERKDRRGRRDRRDRKDRRDPLGLMGLMVAPGIHCQQQSFWETEAVDTVGTTAHCMAKNTRHKTASTRVRQTAGIKYLVDMRVARATSFNSFNPGRAGTQPECFLDQPIKTANTYNSV
jgi:hypothetical protein